MVCKGLCKGFGYEDYAGFCVTCQRSVPKSQVLKNKKGAFKCPCCGVQIRTKPRYRYKRGGKN